MTWSPPWGTPRALHVYDFDGTLLCGGRWVMDTVESIRASSKAAYTVVLTGRPAGLMTPHVRRALDSNGIRPNEVILTPPSELADIPAFKVKALYTLIEFTKPDVVELWDDNGEYLKFYGQWLAHHGVPYRLHHVTECK